MAERLSDEEEAAGSTPAPPISLRKAGIRIRGYPPREDP